MDIEDYQIQLQKENLVDIEVLVGGTKLRNAEVSKLATQLQKNGFCFVLLPKETQRMAKNMIDSMERHLCKKGHYGDKYFSAPQFGIQEQDYKVSFTTLTGKFTKNPKQSGLSQLVPDQNVLGPLQQISENLDFIADRIISYVPEFSQAINRNQYQETLLKDETKQFGALDMVYYHANHNQYDVKPHVDPGLFSINVFNNSQGLQFLNSDKQWVESISNNRSIGVIWNGVYANKVTQGKMAQGWHRVLSTSTGRFTMWYEVVIKSQVPQEIQNNGLLALKRQNNLHDINKLNQMVKNPKKQSDVITIHIQTQDNRKLSLQVNLQQETMGSIKRRMEDRIGLRSMKSGNLIRQNWTAQNVSNPNLKMQDSVPIINYGVKDGDVFYMEVEGSKNKNNNNKNNNKYDISYQIPQFQQQVQLPPPQQIEPVQPKKPMPRNHPTPPYGKYKYADENEIKVMEYHSKVCKLGCILWNGPWGRFLGGKAGSEYFDLTTSCHEGKKLNIQIGWNYNNPAH